MTLASLKFGRKPNLHLRSTPFQCVRKVEPGSVAAVQAETLTNEQSNVSIREQENDKSPAWKRLDSAELGIRNSMIGSTTKKVLNGLKKEGYDVYLVGGGVQDLILKQTPKEFDIITSAEFKEVMRAFSWCEIVGKRFPVCHVHMDDTIVEVSSFDSTKWKAGLEFSHHTEAPNGCDEKDHLRWMNCLNRDFTTNGLMLDPYARIVYDYFGGIEDIIKAKVRTVIPAETSFQEDCARILRAIRVAARLGFSISKETAHFIKNLSCSVLSLDKGRLLMEMYYMLANGSSEASLRLLWKFGLLDILLPFQAAYFAQHGFQRRDRRTNMLLTLFSNLDKLFAPNRPCHNSLWFGILALHKALSDRPRDPLAVAAFSLVVHSGGYLLEAVNIAGIINKPHDVRFPELLDPSGLNAEALEAEMLDLAESVRGTILQMTDEYFVSQAMADYPQALRSNLAFIPTALYVQIYNIFYCVRRSTGKKFLSKQSRKIDYESLALGNLQEVHVFARIVSDTLYPLHPNQNQSLRSNCISPGG